MSNKVKLKATTESTFGIGKGVLDFSDLTTSRTLKFPDSNGTNGRVLSTNGAGVLSWIDQLAGTDDDLVSDYIGPGETLTIGARKQHITVQRMEVASTGYIDIDTDGILAIL